MPAWKFHGGGADDEARNYRCGGFAAAETLGQAKQALTQGPVVASINHYDTPPTNPSPEENYLRYNSQNDYEDTTPKPGIPYYYALVPVYQGTHGWWLTPDSSTNAESGNGQAKTRRLGSSRPFGRLLTGSDTHWSLSTESGESTGEDLEMIYNGPATFEKPDFCLRRDVNQAQ